mgnify:FL=1
MNNLTLLYVEDEIQTIQSIDFFLKRLFKEVFIAQDGEEALSLFSEKKPDVVILDISIPKIDGLKVASKIRKENSEIPIIFITAHSENDKLLKAINLQTYSYLVKPIRVDELNNIILKCIKSVLDKREKNPNKILADGFEWNQEKNTLFYKGVRVPLTKNEVILTEFFIKNSNKIFSIEDIIEYCFYDEDMKNNSVIQLISRFKKKTADMINSKDFFIENIYNKGYRLK